MHNLESHLSKFSEGRMPLDHMTLDPSIMTFLWQKNVYKLHKLESIFQNLPGACPRNP